MKSTVIAVVAIVAVILVAGCTGGTREVTASDNDGIIINEFLVEPARINAEETAIFSMEIENVGGTTAENVRVNLYGLPGWQIANEIPFSEMDPPDISIQPNTPGDFQLADWELEAPNPGEGIVSPYEVRGRVRYHYRTTSIMKIPIYTKQEQKRITDLGNEMAVADIINVRAPVKVNLDRNDVIIYDSEDPDQEYKRRLTISNVGSGVPIGLLDGEEVDGVITGTVRLDGPAVFTDCFGATSGKTVDVESGEIRIRQSASVPKLCAIKINADAIGNAPTETISISMDLDYDYYVEATAIVEVAGKK